MSEAANEGGEEKKSGGFFAIARKIDTAVFNIEKSIVAFSLVTITVVLFVDVVARRATAPDSKVGQFISKIARIDDFETREWVDANVAPWVTLGLALLVLGFGLYSARRFQRQRDGATEAVSTGRELGLAAGFAVAAVAAGWGLSFVFDDVEWSWMVYAGTFAVSSVALAGYHFVRKKDGWQVRLASALVSGGVLVWVATEYVPIGYTWSKQVSLMLLLWVGLLSASICVYAGKHIRMGAAQKLQPEGMRRYVNGTGFLATAVFCALMAYLGFMYIFAPEASDDEYMTEIFTFGGTRYVFGFEGSYGRGGLLEGTDIPDWLGILAAPVGFGIATIRFVGAGISSYLGGSYGESAAEEGMEEAAQTKVVIDDDEPAEEPAPEPKPAPAKDEEE